MVYIALSLPTIKRQYNFMLDTKIMSVTNLYKSFQCNKTTENIIFKILLWFRPLSTKVLSYIYIYKSTINI